MSTSDFMNIGGSYSDTPGFDQTGNFYGERDGFDLIWRQSELQKQMEGIEDSIRAIETNANLSDTEKMFALQMAANTWNAVATARTNILKCVSDVLKAIVRNIA